MAMLSAARGRHSVIRDIAVTRLSNSAAKSPNAFTDADSTSFASSSLSPLAPSAAKSLLLKQYDPDKALSIISSVSNSASSPASTRFAVDLAVRRLATARRFADVESLLESRKSDPAAVQESFVGTIILAYGSARMLDHAISTFEDVRRLCSGPPTTVSFNALLSAAVRAKKHRKVRKLFSELSEKHAISPDTVSYSVLIKALCLSGKAEKALEIRKEMEEKGFKVTTFIYTTLLDSLYKKGELEKAGELWNQMMEKGCKPDLAAYNVRIMQKARDGSPEEVLDSISELEAAGLKPDEITYNYLMTCFSRTGRFDDMSEVYKNMKTKGCEPNAATFKIMLNSLSEKGDFDAGFDIFKDSAKHNRIPDFRTLRPFVVGLAKNLKVEEAKMVISVVRQRFPESLITGWKVVEEELGLRTDGRASDQIEAAESTYDDGLVR